MSVGVVSTRRRGRFHARAAASLLASLLLSACAPVWTNLKQDSALTKVDDPNEKVCLRPRGGKIPYDCIEAARDELISLQIAAGRYNKALAYTAVAGGTYAGYQASRSKPNVALLKHAAIGVAALVGLNSVVGADQQITTLDAGIAALDCVRQAADAIDTDTIAADAPADVEASRGAPAEKGKHVVVSQGLARIATSASTSTPVRQIRPVDADDMKVRVATLVGTTAAAARVPAGERLGGGLAALVEAKASHLNAVNAEWNKAAVASQSKAPLLVYNAVITIRQEIRRQLMLDHVDVQALYKTQQQAVGTLIGELATTAAAQTKLASSVETVMGGDLALEKAGTASTDVFTACAATIGSN